MNRGSEISVWERCGKLMRRLSRRFGGFRAAEGGCCISLYWSVAICAWRHLGGGRDSPLSQVHKLSCRIFGCSNRDGDKQQGRKFIIPPGRAARIVNDPGLPTLQSLGGLAPRIGECRMQAIGPASRDALQILRQRELMQNIVVDDPFAPLQFKPVPVMAQSSQTFPQGYRPMAA